MIEGLQLDGTFPDFASQGVTPDEEIRRWATAIWGNPIAEDMDGPKWWTVHEVNGMQVGGEVGAITDGTHYFTLDPEVTGIRRLDITSEGEVVGSTQLYRSNETGTLKIGSRAVFWL